MEFIGYDDIVAVKAGVQEAGMIMGEIICLNFI